MPDNANPSRLRLTPPAKARLAEITVFEPTIENLSDAELQRKTQELTDRQRGKKTAVGGP